jgi:cyclopropane fatty-acyl-phospholipid synthase-like methyltransferase
MIKGRLKKKSKKVITTEKWVDNYILQNGMAPTYDIVAKNFGISKTAAYDRCQRFREKFVNLSSRNRSKREIEDYLLRKYNHLCHYYNSYLEFKTHFLSGNVKIPLTEVVDLIKLKLRRTL